MDLTKYGLYTALAIVTYLMLLQWQEDFPPTIDDGGSSRVEIPQIPNAQSGSQEGNDLPSDIPTSAPEIITSNASDTPTVAAVTNPSAADTTNTEDLISIRTDTFDIRIDPIGGDIVHLALPLYLKQIDVADDPFVLLDDQPGREYIAQSGLIGANGVDSDGRAIYRATSTRYSMSESSDSLNVDLTTTNADGIEVIKRYGFNRNSYLIDISFIVNNRSSENWQANAFGQIKRDAFDDPSDAGGFGRTYLGFVTTMSEDPYIEIEFDDIDDKGSDTIETTGGWVAFSQHYFLTAWVPDAESLNRMTTRKNGSNQYYGEFTSSAFEVAAGETGSHSIQYYAGPKDQYVLRDISPGLDKTIDYSFLWFIAGPIYWLLSRINSVIGNYGISIVLLTVVVKSAFYKLSETQYRSMAGMRRLMPKMQQLKESYGDDR